MRPSPSVLIVEDHSETREVFELVLAHAGFDVAFARSGLEGREALSRSHPSVVLLDRTLPDMDGLDLLPHVDFDRTRVIAMTGLALPEERDRSLAAGCRGHLVKPIEPRTLVDEVRSALAP